MVISSGIQLVMLDSDPDRSQFVVGAGVGDGVGGSVGGGVGTAFTLTPYWRPLYFWAAVCLAFFCCFLGFGKLR